MVLEKTWAVSVVVSVLAFLRISVDVYKSGKTRQDEPKGGGEG